MSKFYTYDQNNSFGTFVVDEKKGIGQHVIIEAADYKQANAIAESIGLYFNGVDNDLDCPCCGDRWYVADEFNSTDKPTTYGKKAFVHYLNGNVEKVVFDN